MRDEHTAPAILNEPDDQSPEAGWMRRVERTKVTVPVVIGFMMVLAMFCLAAAGAGSLVHHLKTH